NRAADRRVPHGGYRVMRRFSLRAQSLDEVLAAGAAAGAGEAAGAAAGAAAAPSPTRLRFLSPSFLKSVSYQPPPASRNEGALTRRCTLGAPHSGQSTGSASDSFCRRS